MLFATIPVSIASNTTSYEHGLCMVDHPLVSAVLPPSITAVAHTLQLIFFAEVLVASSALTTREEQTQRIRRVAMMLLVTNGIGAASSIPSSSQATSGKGHHRSLTTPSVTPVASAVYTGRSHAVADSSRPVAELAMKPVAERVDGVAG
ncbi:hypothetical protein GGF32_009555 [Allomyces javanicus]|nr:hypothetical protein GGF32_009555 [Allomyces javanicus]